MMEKIYCVNKAPLCALLIWYKCCEFWIIESYMSSSAEPWTTGLSLQHCSPVDLNRTHQSIPGVFLTPGTWGEKSKASPTSTCLSPNLLSHPCLRNACEQLGSLRNIVPSLYLGYLITILLTITFSLNLTFWVIGKFLDYSTELKYLMTLRNLISHFFFKIFLWEHCGLLLYCFFFLGKELLTRG